MVISDASVLEAAQKRNREVLELIERIQSGDLDAFAEIIRRHERRVLGMAVQMGLSPEDAQDAGQEVFLRVFRYLSGFQSGRNFEVWIWKIAVNVVYDQLRKRRDRGEVSWDAHLENGAEEPSRSSGIHLHLENSQLCARLLKHMDALSKQERMVFVLRELQELDTAEVARAMGISRITVRRHGSSARQKLRRALEGIQGGSP
ncbi:MAG: sigma-70 family RNA polymerase sigma factor [Acidobacteria bacterium]|nr:sigma-70 family RNA polymerase sigma factor [Acidobacteriota bacterium]